MSVFPLRQKHDSSSGKPRRLRTCQQCLQIPHPLELTSQQVPIIRVDRHLSVCFFDVGRQPERDLSCLRLLTHESLEVRCHWCPFLITEIGGSVHKVSVRPIEEDPCRDNSPRFLLLQRTEARDDQVRKSVSRFCLRHDQWSRRTSSTSALNEESVE